MVTHSERLTDRPAVPDVTVTPMRPRHLGEVLAIERAVYPRPWSGRLFASEIRQSQDRRYVVALARDGLRPVLARMVRPRCVVGYAGVLLQTEEAHISTVAVHPRFHRRKIASHLLVALLRKAIRAGCQAATLEVRANNRGAQRLYSGFGFAPVGVRANYYAETAEDAVIMWLHDLQGAEVAQRVDAQAARLGEPGGASGAPDLHVPWVQGRVGLQSRRPGG